MPTSRLKEETIKAALTEARMIDPPKLTDKKKIDIESMRAREMTEILTNFTRNMRDLETMIIIADRGMEIRDILLIDMRMKMVKTIRDKLIIIKEEATKVKLMMTTERREIILTDTVLRGLITTPKNNKASILI